MNRDILNIILNDVIYNDINSIKKTSLICKYIHNNIQLLSMKDEIKSMFNILQKYSDPYKCMEEATKNGHINIVQLIIENGALSSDHYCWIMCCAADKGHINIVQFLIDKGANYWNEALMHAAKSGHMNIVQLMIEKGANNWNHSMVIAIKYGHINIVQLMIEKGANNWDIAMKYAVKSSHHEVANIVELLEQQQSLKN
jgi:ankyrin repeat protein